MNESKIIKILNKLKRELNEFKEKERYYSSRDLIKELSEAFNEKAHYKIEYSSMLIPLETFSTVSCKSPNISNSIGQALEYLKDRKTGVLAFDGSYFTPSAHLKIPIHIVNVGVWYQNYSKDSHGSFNHVEIFFDIPDKRIQRIKSKEIEYETVYKCLKNLDEDIKIILYDEAFNLNYTLAWDHESRKSLIRLLKNHLEEIIKLKIIPLAVFYTSSIDLLRSLSSITGTSIDILGFIPDRTIMNTFLETGQRSNLFKVHSRALVDSGIKLVAFYIKVGGGNILRVEFPEEYLEQVDIIHCTVLAQAVLGNGYPIAMQRAHEWAVLSSQDRIIIEEEIARLLKLPYREYLISKKLESKRRPIV